jgi:hypothetical protein
MPLAIAKTLLFFLPRDEDVAGSATYAASPSASMSSSDSPSSAALLL